MLSYYDYSTGSKDTIAELDQHAKAGNDLFMDSGAYTAFNSGHPIDLADYIKFSKLWGNKITHFATLDKIGDPNVSWVNFKKMMDAGTNPMPVVHLGADLKWFDKYLSLGCDVIGLGGMVLVGAKAMSEWLDAIFYKYPTVKFHGFGITTVSVMLRFPWYSVDSSSWIKTAAFGGALLPMPGKNNIPDYTKTPLKIRFSDRPGDAGKDDYNSLSAGIRKYVDAWLEECGVTGELLCKDYVARRFVLATYFNRLGYELGLHQKEFGAKAGKSRKGFGV